MLTKFSEAQARNTSTAPLTLGTQITLWSIWTLYVVGFAFAHWYFDLAASRPFPIVGLVIHTTLAGLFGLIVMTWMEIRLYPERFTDS